MKFSRVVFCDFDGTITTGDTFADMLEKFTPEVSARLLPLIFERKMTLAEGMKKTLGSIPSIRYSEIIEYITHQPIRPGFIEFADFLNDLDIPLVIVSGGLVDMVEAVLTKHQLINKVTAIYAGNIDTTKELLRAYSNMESDTEFVAKVEAMKQYRANEKVAIGDSVTDINMALAADLVFARDRLVGYLDAEHKPYIQWQDFLDIRDRLATRWQLNS